MTWPYLIGGCLVVLVVLHLLLIVKHAKLEIRNRDLEKRLLSYRLSAMEAKNPPFPMPNMHASVNFESTKKEE